MCHNGRRLEHPCPEATKSLTYTVGLFAYPGVTMTDPNALVSGPDAAAYLTDHTPSRITGAMIRKWASRGYSAFIRDQHGRIVTDENGKPKTEKRRLEAVDHKGPRGSARYRWTDLLDAERDTRRNPRSPGRGRSKELAIA